MFDVGLCYFWFFIAYSVDVAADEEDGGEGGREGGRDAVHPLVPVYTAGAGALPEALETMCNVKEG